MSAASAGSEQTWNRDDVVATYAARRYITPAEVRVLAECWPQLRGGRVLDIGVGTGRTVPFVAPVAASYVGIDFMPNMVATAQRLRPGRELRVGDARALQFGDGERTFVLFSFCGIDYVDPAERGRVLAEVRRVLAPGGVFAYSTHNLASLDRVRNGFRPEAPNLGGSVVRNAVELARGATATVRAYRNYRRLRDQQRFGDDIAFIIDGNHESSLLTCYVTQAHERAALEQAGFRVRSVIEPDGTDASPASRARDLYFVADRID